MELGQHFSARSIYLRSREIHYGESQRAVTAVSFDIFHRAFPCQPAKTPLR